MSNSVSFRSTFFLSVFIPISLSLLSPAPTNSIYVALFFFPSLSLSLPFSFYFSLVTLLLCVLPSELQDGWDSIELIPNIILNPGFSESDGAKSVPPFTRTVIFGHTGQRYNANNVADVDDDDDDDYEEEEDLEPTMEKFKRKVSVFFTGPTIKRI